MSHNRPSQTTTLNAIMRSKAFAAGVEDQVLGLKYDADSWDTWAYDFGRLWAAATGETSVRVVRGIVLQEQQELFWRCWGKEIPMEWQGPLPDVDELGL